MKNAGRESEIRSKIRQMDSHPEYQDEIRTFVLENGGLNYASDCLERYIDKSKAALEALEDSLAKDCLISIAEYNTLRNI